MNLMEAHWPYWGEAQFLTYNNNPVDVSSETIPGGDIDLSTHKKGYNEWVAYLSEIYEKIFDQLLKEFDYVVTLADHGDLFGEHGAKAHYYGLFPELIKVPLVISGDVKNGVYREDIVSIIDVHATICAMAGVPSTNNGINLLNSTQAEPRLIEFHGFRPDRIESLRADGYSSSQIEHYDKHMTAVAMPEDYYGYETPNGFEESGTPIKDPRQAITRLRGSLEKRPVSQAETETVSEGTKERLQRLGYIN
jgi:arylsulfatase